MSFSVAMTDEPELQETLNLAAPTELLGNRSVVMAPLGGEWQQGRPWRAVLMVHAQPPGEIRR